MISILSAEYVLQMSILMAMTVTLHFSWNYFSWTFSKSWKPCWLLDMNVINVSMNYLVDPWRARGEAEHAGAHCQVRAGSRGCLVTMYTQINPCILQSSCRRSRARIYLQMLDWTMQRLCIYSFGKNWYKKYFLFR